MEYTFFDIYVESNDDDCGIRFSYLLVRNFGGTDSIYFHINAFHLVKEMRKHINIVSLPDADQVQYKRMLFSHTTKQ